MGREKLGSMYVEAFGLRRDPFMDTADPAFYYETIACAHGRRRLVECLVSGRGLAVVVGPIGAGKTTLCNAVAQDVLAQPNVRAGLILDPTFADEREFLGAAAASLAIDFDPALSLRDLKDVLKRALFDSVARDEQYVLFIDEAQLLPEPTLESLRSLLNYQIDDRKLLSVALAGQMELAGALARRPNLRDRVATWVELGPLADSEASALLDHRLRRAGFSGAASPFSPESATRIWNLSGGLPRRLTSIAREAMEVAAERGARAVTEPDVLAALKRLPPATPIDAGTPKRNASQESASQESRRTAKVRWPWSWFAR